MSASVARIPGVVSADLNFASATLLVVHDPAIDPSADVERVVKGTGHGIARLDESGRAVSTETPRPWFERHLAEIATAGSGGFSLLGAVLGWIGASEAAVTASFAVAIVFGGLLVWRRAWTSLKARILDMNVLMSAAVFGAAALGEWGEGATVFFLFALGGLLESRSLERTRRSIRDLMELAPAQARVVRGGGPVTVAPDTVGLGEIVVIRPGERIPLDGDILSGATSVDESAITGESVPADKSPGDRVFAGTLNTTGLVEIEVTAIAEDSTLSRIVYLVEEAQAARAPAQHLVDRFSRVYTPAVIVLALAVALVVPLVAGLLGVETEPLSEWVRRGLVVLVVSCPCALVISTPVSIVSGITRASRDGVLVKGGAFLETAAKIRAVAFDKTGTLTLGRPRVHQIEPFGPVSEGEVLRIAAALEANSNHPVARAVVSAADEAGLSATMLPVAAGVVETPGRGVRGSVEGGDFELCSPECARESAGLGPEVEEALARIEGAGSSVLVLVGDGGAAGSEAPFAARRVVGLLGVADTVRPEARGAITAVRGGGIEHLIMLTGDNERVAEAVAARVGLSGFLARLLPEGKTEAIGVLQRRYGLVAMVGDGVNDAPALAAADIGIAMGAAGSDTALETADVALMGDDLGAIAGFLALGRRTMRIIIQNVTASIAVKVVFLGLALTGQATLWMAVFADTGVALLVILNGMRLLRQHD